MDNFNSFLEHELNEAQKQAVMQNEGAILVIAGAGSGKTRVITARLAHLIINHNTDPRSLVALTFTNKAAQEMKHRLTGFLGTDKGLPFVGTFHSYCLYLLRTNPQLAPYANFTILDDDDQVSILRKFIKASGLEKQISPRSALSQISAMKNTPTPNQVKTSFMQELYHAYEQEKKRSNSLDFDDLLLEVLKLFQTNEEFKNRFQERMSHVLVDEYQDTNHVQHDLLRHMILRSDGSISTTSLCAVGDEDQSIYSWRGAVVENIQKFQDEFAPVTTIKIEQNYRSVEPILKAANSVIKNNSSRNEKKLWSTRQARDRIMHITCKSEYQEADAITRLIVEAQNLMELRDMAILYRTHYQSRPLEEALIRASIPYRIIGGLQFYQRKEIKDILAYMRLVLNGRDKVSFYRVLNTPTRGFGEKFEELVAHEWDKMPDAPFSEVLELMLVEKIVDPTSKRGIALQDFLTTFEGLKGSSKPSKVIDSIIERVEYYTYLRSSYEPEEYEVKRDNVKELRQAAEYYEKNPETGKDTSVETFLHEVALLQDKLDASKEDDNCIKLMTLHGAKGLEFKLVMIAGIEEDIFPSSRAIVARESLEEERRLFYVGITRAKDYLLLSHASMRNSYGSTNQQSPSRFLREIPSSLLLETKISHLPPFELKSLFRNWLNITSTKKDIMLFGGVTLPSDDVFEKSRPTQTIKATPATMTTSTKSFSGWRKNRIVEHATFGSGIIKEVEEKKDGTYFVTVQFKAGTKKLLSSFLKLT